jgi:hypothetical protein
MRPELGAMNRAQQRVAVGTPVAMSTGVADTTANHVVGT